MKQCLKRSRWRWHYFFIIFPDVDSFSQSLWLNWGVTLLRDLSNTVCVKYEAMASRPFSSFVCPLNLLIAKSWLVSYIRSSAIYGAQWFRTPKICPMINLFFFVKMRFLLQLSSLANAIITSSYLAKTLLKTRNQWEEYLPSKACYFFDVLMLESEPKLKVVAKEWYSFQNITRWNARV